MDCTKCINVELVELTTGEKYYFCHEANARVENIEFNGKECQCFEEKQKWSCYDCMWASDKCKNTDSDQYNKFLKDIEKCNLTGVVDNSLGRSWRRLGENID